MSKEKVSNLKEIYGKKLSNITPDDKVVSSSPYEVCVCCGEETNVKKDFNINNKTNYIDNAGKLCIKCYNTLYELVSNSDNI